MTTSSPPRPAGPTPLGRPALATALSGLIPRHRWPEVFPITPARLLARHRRLVARTWDYSTLRSPWRSPPAAALRRLIVEMARANPDRGHRRIQGELNRLGRGIANPDRAWTAQTARNGVVELDKRFRPVKYLIRDRDGRFTSAFDAVSEAEGVEILRSPV